MIINIPLNLAPEVFSRYNKTKRAPGRAAASKQEMGN